MNKYSDEDLRERLKAYGQDVGPINSSTRPYWEKALSKLDIEHGVSPITSATKTKPRAKQLRRKTPIIVTSPNYCNNPIIVTRSVESPKSMDQSLSEENESFVKDSPGSTPFPARSQRNKKSPKTSPVESLAKYANRKNCHASATPNSTRNRKLECFNKVQQRDRELREKLKKFGESMHTSPMNDAIRNQWRKRLIKLHSGGSGSPMNLEEDTYYFGDCQDDFENEYEARAYDFQEYQKKSTRFRKCMIYCLTFTLRAIVCAIIIIIGVFLMISPEDIKEIEASLD